MLLKLVDGEQVVVRTRAHHRALLPAVINLLVTIVLMSFLLGYVSRPTQPAFIEHYRHILVFLIWAAGLISLAFGSLKPALVWLNRFTYLTTERVVQKNLIGAAQATVVPLALLSQVELRISRMQGMSGAGDLLLIHGAYGQHQRTRLKDMPDAERFNTLIAEQLSEYRRRAARAAYAAGPQPYAAPGDVYGSAFGR